WRGLASRGAAGQCITVARPTRPLPDALSQGWQQRILDDDPRAVLVFRALAMAQSIKARQRCVQLSALAHAGHWIDPAALVQRSLMAASGESPATLGPSDQVLALLRLAPDGREPTLRAANVIPDEWGCALRYALGGDEPVGHPGHP